MWGVGMAGGEAGGFEPEAAEGIRRLPRAEALGRPAKLEKLKYNIFGLHINSPDPFNSFFASKEVWNVSIDISNSHKKSNSHGPTVL